VGVRAQRIQTNTMPRTIDGPLVIIFGRTNVGKSTLFNALTEKNQALISNIPGTTRDANLSEVKWRGQRFFIIDTGGFIDLDFLRLKKIKAETIDELVQKQARDYLKKADLILFIVDARDGLLPQDQTMAAILKRIIPDKKNIVLVANKTEKLSLAHAGSDFYRLGLGDVIPISALTGAGTGDMLDLVLEKIKASPDPVIEPVQENAIRVSIIGKPNVGKSSLLNAILGYPRVIVSTLPHTTREPQSEKVQYKDQAIIVVDTAGITKHGHKVDNLEKYSMDKSLAAVRKSDISLLVLDVSENLTKQDARLVEEVTSKGKSLILIANKWDLASPRDPKKYARYIYGELPFADYAPIQFLSAKNRLRISQLLDLILEVNKQRYLTLTDNAVERLLKTAVRKHRPTKGKGTKYPRIYEFKQSGVNPPSFMVRIGAAESLADSYLRFLENQLREKFGFSGTPIKMWVQKGRDVHGAHHT